MKTILSILSIPLILILWVIWVIQKLNKGFEITFDNWIEDDEQLLPINHEDEN